ncbi:MAG: hypothetical protein H0T46_23140 [Deltaproteobacteria bacterium]|nr:hypothetical protein [Deltaproteobacteria bacterium]
MSSKDRVTRELDREQLAKLAKDAAGDAAPVERQEEIPSSPRTATLQDPLTMALLAEVARSSRTRDFDPQDEEITAERDPERADLPHPVLLRR